MYKLKKIALSEALNTFFGAQNIAAKLMVGKHQLVEVVLNSIFGRIFVDGHFLQNHIPFFFDLRLRKSTVEGNIGEEIKSLVGMVVEYRRIKANIFFGGVSVQLTTERIKLVDDLKRASL